MTVWPEYMRIVESPTLTALSPATKAAQGGRVMGYMIAKSEGRDTNWHGHVTALSVAPEYRRVGLAGRLMRGFEDTSDRSVTQSHSDAKQHLVHMTLQISHP